MFPVFLEALCPFIDRASTYPPNENKEDWPMEKKQAKPLIKKLEKM